MLEPEPIAMLLVSQLSAFVLIAAALHYRGASERLKLYLLLGLGTAIRLFVALQNPLALQDWPLNDDSHYYFMIARNLVSGAGLKHDTFHVTTGFQPLFLLLTLPLFALIHDRLLVINAVLVLQTLIGLACGILFFRLGRLVVPKLALLAPAIWATSPVLVYTDVNGMETNTSLCLLLLTVTIYLRDFQGASALRTLDYARLGALCGLAFLARIDLGLLLPVLSVDLFLRQSKLEARGPLLGKLAVMNSVATLVLAPWLVFNLATIRSVLPSSGQAVRFLAQAYGYRYLGGSGPAFDIGHPPLVYLFRSTLFTLRELLAVLNGVVPAAAAVGVVVLALLVAGPRLLGSLGRLWFLFIFLTALFCAYSWYIFGHWFLRRYMLPMTLGYVVVLLVAAAGAVERFRGSAWGRHALFGLALATLTFSLRGTLVRVNAAPYCEPIGNYGVAMWVNAHTPKGAVIGSFQTGILGYFLDRPFHGLDGKINVEALHAMQTRTMDKYVEREHIDYLMDWPWILDALFSSRAADPHFLERQRLVKSGYYDVYEVSHTSPASSQTTR
jgi:hypothetical protein